MSGLEIIGVAASVIPIADLGARLSVQLIGFSRKVREAHKNIEAISQEIAVTGAVLQELGTELKKDENKSACSRDALVTAKQLIEACKEIFQEIEENVRPKGPASATPSFKQRLKYPFFESRVTLLQTKLESLKSSLLVILNVLVFAEQVRTRETLPVLKEQRVLLELLVQEKNSNELKLRRALQDKPIDQQPPVFPSQRNIVTAHQPETLNDESQLAFLGSEVRRELLGHSLLVDTILHETEQPRYNLSPRLASKVQESVLGVHWVEWSHLSRIHGHDQLLKGFSKNKALHSYWAQYQGHRALPWHGHSMEGDRTSGPTFVPTDTAHGRDPSEEHSGHWKMPLTSPQHVWKAEPVRYSVTPPAGTSGNHALQDYQMQLMLLEQQRKKRLMMARSEQDNAGDWGEQPTGRIPRPRGSRNEISDADKSPAILTNKNQSAVDSGGREAQTQDINSLEQDSEIARPSTPTTRGYQDIQGCDALPSPPTPTTRVKSGAFESGKRDKSTRGHENSEYQPLDPGMVYSPEGSPTGPRDNQFSGDFSFGADQNFNLDFSTLEDAEVLENFDFDSFLQTTSDDTFNFDGGIGVGDGSEFIVGGDGTDSPVTEEIHALLSQFGGFREEELSKVLRETTSDEKLASSELFWAGN